MVTSGTGVRAREGAPHGASSLRAPVSRFKSMVFDCDGTLLDTARVKTEAFRTVAARYGAEYGERMAEFHQQAGSIGRRARWEHFFTEILGRGTSEAELMRCVEDCTREVLRGTLDAPMVPGIAAYLDSLAGSRRYVVSGIETSELNAILEVRGLRGYFDGTWGGQKARLLCNLVADGDILLPAVYFGDTPEDGWAAAEAGLDFVFVSGCSEFDAADFPAGTRTITDYREVLA